MFVLDSGKGLLGTVEHHRTLNFGDTGSFTVVEVLYREVWVSFQRLVFGEH